MSAGSFVLSHHWEARGALAAAIGVALYPLLLLWLDLLGLSPLRWLGWLAPTAGAIVLLVSMRRSPPRRPWLKFRTLDAVFLLAILVIVGVRLLPVQALPAPLWGDSLQHTMIVQLLLDHDGLFRSWEPYAPMRTFTYHFGYHTTTALWTLFAGVAERDQTPRAVLEISQWLNALSVIALIPLATRLSRGNRWAGLGALLVAGLLSPFPAFYVNWGRYTQMAGQIILPAFLWALDVWWREEKRPSPRFLGLITLLAAGLALTHYRVVTVAGLAAVGWALWGLWIHRDNLSEWRARLGFLVGAAAVAGILILPWVFRIRAGRLGTIAVAITNYRESRYEAFLDELRVWLRMDDFYPRWLWMSGCAAALAAAWRQREMFVPWALAAGAIFLGTNPFLFGLPGSGWITNFLLVIAAYIPLALFLGWLLGAVWGWLVAFRPWGAGLIFLSCLPLLAVGVRTQLTIVDPFFQMVTWSDVAAYRWIREEIPEDAHFLINGFLAYSDTVAVGSDGGWWLPFYTLRSSTIPPLLYAAEAGPTPEFHQRVRQTVIDVAATQGEPAALNAVLCKYGVTHVYLGDKRGQVGYGAQPLVPEDWLRVNPALTLLYQEDMAQVWRFDVARCPPSSQP